VKLFLDTINAFISCVLVVEDGEMHPKVTGVVTEDTVSRVEVHVSGFWDSQ
jgi:hypothetical protein